MKDKDAPVVFRPFVIFEGRVYAARTVRREEAKALDSLRDRVERWT